MEIKRPADPIIRSFKTGDEEKINDLFNEVFGKNRDMKMWKWRFFDNPFKSRNMNNDISIAEDNERIVGQYCVIPRLFNYKGSIIKAVQPLDNIVASEHRNLKVQFDMLEYLEKTAREGVCFGYGFPNEIAYLVGKRVLKYKDLCELPVLFRRLNFGGAVRSRIKWLPGFAHKMISSLSSFFFLGGILINRRGSKKNVKVIRIERFAGGFDSLWKRVKDNYPIIGKRDAVYLNWRYLDRPRFSYTAFSAGGEEPEGFMVLFTEKQGFHNVGIIMDFLYTNKDVFNSLLSRALEYFISNRVDHVLCWAIREGREYDLLFENGFTEDKNIKPIKVVYKIFDDEIDEAFLKNPLNWLITAGDSH